MRRARGRLAHGSPRQPAQRRDRGAACSAARTALDTPFAVSARGRLVAAGQRLRRAEEQAERLVRRRFSHRRRRRPRVLRIVGRGLCNRLGGRDRPGNLAVFHGRLAPPNARLVARTVVLRRRRRRFPLPGCRQRAVAVAGRRGAASGFDAGLRPLQFAVADPRRGDGRGRDRLLLGRVVSEQRHLSVRGGCGRRPDRLAAAGRSGRLGTAGASRLHAGDVRFVVHHVARCAQSLEQAGRCPHRLRHTFPRGAECSRVPVLQRRHRCSGVERPVFGLRSGLPVGLRSGPVAPGPLGQNAARRSGLQLVQRSGGRPSQ